MAVSINENADKYTRTISLGTVSTWTVTCWVKLASSRSGASQVPWQIDNGSGGNFFRLNFYNGSGAAHQTSGNAWFGAISLTATMGTWYFIGISGTATPGSEQVRTVHRADGSLTWGGSTSPQAATTFSAQTLRIGGSDTTAQHIDGSMCAIKVWSSALSREEMMTESWSFKPRRTNGLRAFYPFLVPETTDYSGGGWTLTAGTATADTNPGPALPWGTSRRRVIIPMSGGGPAPVGGVLAASLPPLGGGLDGGLSIDGVLAGALPALGGDLAGAATVSGQADAELPALGAGLAGHVGAPGFLAATLPALTGQLTGEVTGGFLVADLPALTGSLAGQLTAHGALDASLPALTGGATGEVEIPPHDITCIPGPPQRRWASRGPATTWTAAPPARGWRARTPTT